MREVCGSVFGVWEVLVKCVWVWEMCWGRGNVRKMGVQGNVGRSVLGRRKVGEMWGEVKKKCGGSEKMWGEV